jgi:hypothetical protein
MQPCPEKERVEHFSVLHMLFLAGKLQTLAAVLDGAIHTEGSKVVVVSTSTSGFGKGALPFATPCACRACAQHLVWCMRLPCTFRQAADAGSGA